MLQKQEVETNALLVIVKNLFATYDLLDDLLAIPMCTMISPLALQLLQMAIYNKKDAKNAVFDGILQFVADTATQRRKAR